MSKVIGMGVRKGTVHSYLVWLLFGGSTPIFFSFFKMFFHDSHIVVDVVTTENDVLTTFIIIQNFHNTGQ